MNLVHDVTRITIRCARCGHPVERATWWYDRGGKDYIAVVRCHGAREECHLDPAAVDSVVEAVAFAPKPALLPKGTT